MQLTPEQEQELEENGMGKDTVGRFYYNEQRKLGLTHPEAIRNFVDGLNNMQSTSLTSEQMKTLKYIIGRVKGEMF